MLLLANNCSASKPTVNPKNWQTCRASALKKPWQIQYYFRDPAHKRQYPYGKLCVVKGMNHLKTLAERREAVAAILENEVYMLKVEGYNPISKTYAPQVVDSLQAVNPSTFFADALEYAFTSLQASAKTKKEVGRLKKHFVNQAKQMRLAGLKIGEVRRSHVRAILEDLADSRGYSDARFNKVRAYVSMLFKELVNVDVVEVNPVAGIRKRKTVRRMREVLTDKQLKKVKKHLQTKRPEFFRFVLIFYYSGSRTTELLRVKKEDVDLEKQVFKIVMNKGRFYSEQLRGINNAALPYWRELVEAAEEGQYIFSKNLKPGAAAIDAWQISKRWRVHVKDKLGITADFYALKHLHTTRVIEQYGEDLAAGINGHTSTAMNSLHYDANKKARQLRQAKNLQVGF